MSDPPCRVLVVEDDGAFRGLLAETLRDEGFEVRSTSDGVQALGAVQEWGPDLIVLDLDLPLMNGLAFRAHQSGMAGADSIPTVILSGHDDLKRRVQVVGADVILSKPCDLDVVIASLHRLAELRGLDAASSGLAPS